MARECGFGESAPSFQCDQSRAHPALARFDERALQVGAVRKQYYFRPSDRGMLAWDVDRLVELTAELPRKQIPLKELNVLDEEWFGKDEPGTWRELLEHVKLMDEADLSYPIILAADGAVMDGRHRIAKAIRAGLTYIEAVQFEVDPPPDHVG